MFFEVNRRDETLKFREVKSSVVGIKPTVGLTSRAGVVPISLRQDTIGRGQIDNSTIEASKYIPKGEYSQFLRADRLKGKRIGTVRKFYDFGHDDAFYPGAFEKVFKTLNGEWTALLAKFKISLNEYLKELVASPIRSLSDAIEFNKKNSKLDGYERLMIKNKLDAIAAPGRLISPILPIGGFPQLVYQLDITPYGIGFGGLKGFESRLIEIAYGFEHLTKSRQSPSMKRQSRTNSTITNIREMKKNMENTRLAIGLLVLFLAAISARSEYYSKTAPRVQLKEKVTNLHFFLFDILSGKKPSAVEVAHSNITIGDQSATPFGSVYAVDDPLREGPDPNSKVIGNARGLYVSASQDPDLCLVMYIDYGFTTGKYNGSSISVFSRNPVTEPQREVAVVGGRGEFKMARGFAKLKTHYLNVTNGDAIIEYNVTVFHY
ncbi:unnamed protein product [Citrullus colocynthis]|uniref:Dirigent protein n=1 Tax=Citrullus colocynthis TaxID=252529 RepID=A0ABP0Y4K1_9ROSI